MSLLATLSVMLVARLGQPRMTALCLRLIVMGSRNSNGSSMRRHSEHRARQY